MHSNTEPVDACCMDCGTLLQISGAAVDLAVVLSRILMNRGEQPMNRAEAVRCPSCRERWERKDTERSMRYREKAIELAKAIRRGEKPLVDTALLDSEWGYIVRDAWQLEHDEKQAWKPRRKDLE